MIATRIGSGRARIWGLAFAMAAGLAQAEDDSALHARYSKAVRAAIHAPVSYTHLTLPTNREV